MVVNGSFRDSRTRCLSVGSTQVVLEANGSALRGRAHDGLGNYINAQLRLLAKERKLMFVDYYSILNDGQGGLREALSNDGVHPNCDGYALMRPVAEKAIAAALHTR